MKDFKADLKYGHRGELVVKDIYISKGYVITQEAPNDKVFGDYDFVAHNPNTERKVSVEVKRERYSTNNIFIEIWYLGKLSGVYTSKSDFYFFVRSDGIYYAPTKELRNHVMSQEEEGYRPTDIKNNSTSGYLVPLSAFTRL